MLRNIVARACSFLLLVSPDAVLIASGDARCQDHTFTVSVRSTDLVYALPELKDDFDVAELGFQVARRDLATAVTPFNGTIERNGTYEISGTFCAPRHASPDAREKTVLLASHGLHFDRRYWDSDIEPKKYSLVQYATSAGYSVFFYDRLGVGASSKLSGYKNQASVQIAVLEELTKALRSGQGTGAIGVPSKIVHVGHSYGSLISLGLVHHNPDISDGLVLTGFAFDDNPGASWYRMEPRLAGQSGRGNNNNNDDRSTYRSSAGDDAEEEEEKGHIVAADVVGFVNNFYKQPSYDAAVARRTFERRTAFAVMEFLSFSSVDLTNTFEGAVMVLNGEFDVLCGGYCPGLVDEQFLPLFRAASVLDVRVHPGAGHALNFATNATGAYEAIVNFLDKTGL